MYARGGGILSHVSGDGALLRVRHTFEGERGAARVERERGERRGRRARGEG